ncbi:NAD(P)H-dependent flavin oxidoreductase [Streptomyces sp. RTd22]|uniref:NAD(P)H-dependent flavin oxidoreductase n=1 Tax=Streptomyces sp. RTd22 TaxID=1841249 RepID=UPI0007C5CC85|nr:nitronate monooxygenase [Streptomyces sp. RTd22]
MKTRLTERFGLTAPLALAPMDQVSNAVLVNAVARAGGLALLGGGYGDATWLRSEQAAVDPAVAARVGVGFITWSLARAPHLLDLALESSPAAVFLSFGDPAPFAEQVKSSGAALVCQVGNLEHASRALDVGADVVVAQGTEGGGHGLGTRSTFTLVPEIADLIVSRNHPALLLAAGGVADGRGLAAALALGADGAVIGTRFWAAREAAASLAAQTTVIGRDGDQTLRQRLYDVVREKDWPHEYSGRVLRNDFVQRWEGKADKGDVDALRDQFHAAVRTGDFDVANVIAGESIGLIRSIQSAASLIDTISSDAAHILGRA